VIGLWIGLAVVVGCSLLAWAPTWRVRRTLAAWSDEVRAAVAEARGDGEKVALVDQLAAELERGLDTDAHWPRTAAWLALAGAVGAVIAMLSWGAPLADLLALAVMGAAAVMLSLAGARGRRQRHEQARHEADRVIAGLVGDLVHREVWIPRPRTPRFKKK
jgi:hypothetical protein